MNCYFRTNISKNSGIGNYMRCLRLALRLKSKGHKCKIFTDQKINNILLNKSIKHLNLYKKNKKVLSEVSDAKIFLENTKSKGFVFVDDYRLGIKWQKIIKKNHEKLIVIDDFLKKYEADVVINTKPNFLNNDTLKKTLSKYKNLKMLLGPKYSIIEKKSNKQKFKKNKFKIAFYIGGGSNLNFIFNLVKKLILINKYNNVEFNLIVGPYSINKKKFFRLKKFSDNIKVINPSKNLSKKINNFDLFIGSAGISIFETALYKTPSIFIKFVKNQEVDISGLEKMGHYFLLNKKDVDSVDKISKLIDIFLINKKRIKKMISDREFKVDDKGVERIIKEVFKKNIKSSINRNFLKKENNVKNIKYETEIVPDKFINEYLTIRNNSINRKQSINKKIINNIDHYIWWFNTNRKSIIFKKGKEKLMLFFHDKIKIAKKEFLIPGWYACQKRISFLDLIAGINFQFRLLTKSKKNKTKSQIGIINKKNKSMIDLAPKLKWKLLDKKDKIFMEIRKRFKFNNEFNIYIR